MNWATGDLQTSSSQPSPDAESPLVSAARQMVEHARPLLHARQALLLAVTSTTCPRTAAPKTVAWDDGCVPVDVLTAMPGVDDALHRSLAAFEYAGTLLLSEMVRRWPVNALPPVLGLVTDGTGIAFSSEHPSPLSPGWLTRHLDGRCPTMTLLLFAPSGAWARLIMPRTSQQLH